ALDAFAAGLPGFKALDLGEQVDPRMSASARQLMAGQDDYIYHFPDGNAALAHALLRELRPDAVPGQGMASLADVKVGQERLDLAEAPVRVRLRATALGLRHLGPPQRAELVELSYVDAAGALRRVRARHLLLACWHRVIARLAPELAAAQRRALDDQVKVDTDQVEIVVPDGASQDDSPVQFDNETPPGAPAEGEGKDASPAPNAEDDAAKALEKALQGDKK
ncbi:MAG: hypothetical protein JNL44_17310, partial [Gemmatimonadetes bacterium]|nr:hypothetical protein [Gemmatimonadota bacterium]